jgi:hypothetical protein
LKTGSKKSIQQSRQDVRRLLSYARKWQITGSDRTAGALLRRYPAQTVLRKAVTDEQACLALKLALDLFCDDIQSFLFSVGTMQKFERDGPEKIFLRLYKRQLRTFIYPNPKSFTTPLESIEEEISTPNMPVTKPVMIPPYVEMVLEKYLGQDWRERLPTKVKGEKSQEAVTEYVEYLSSGAGMRYSKRSGLKGLWSPSTAAKRKALQRALSAWPELDKAIKAIEHKMQRSPRLRGLMKYINQAYDKAHTQEEMMAIMLAANIRIEIKDPPPWVGELKVILFPVTIQILHDLAKEPAEIVNQAGKKV